MTQFSHEIDIHWHLMGLCQNVMIFWHTREHHTEHMYCEKKFARKKMNGTNSNSGTQYFVPLFSGTKCQNQK